MRKRKKRWLRAGLFLACERVEVTPDAGASGPWTLHGVSHEFSLRAPFADLPGVLPFAPLALFVRLTSRLNRTSRPRKLEAHLYHRGEARFVCRYRFLPRAFRPGIITYMALPLQPPPITSAAWYEFLLVLDDERRTVLARTEVYLIP